MNNIICKLCGNNTISFYAKAPKENKYHQCQECSFIFIDNNFLPNQDEEIKIYNLHENHIENKGYVNFLENYIKKAVTPFSKDIKTILDFGSGPGPVLSELLKIKGYEVDIYDPYFSPKKVYLNKKYDMIISTEVFEHFHNPYESIKIISKHLKSGGILSIMTTFPPDIENFNQWGYKNDRTHVSFYTPATFEKIAQLFGYSIIFNDNNRLCVLKKIKESE